MSCNKTLALVTAAVLLVSACVPIPKMQEEAPKIVATLQSQGEPLRGYQVYLSHIVEQPCAGKITDVVLTDSNGHFQVGPTHRLAYVRWLVPSQSHFGFSLCVVSPDGEMRWLDTLNTNNPSSARNERLSCDYQKLRTVPAADGNPLFVALEEVCDRE